MTWAPAWTLHCRTWFRNDMSRRVNVSSGMQQIAPVKTWNETFSETSVCCRVIYLSPNEQTKLDTNIFYKRLTYAVAMSPPEDVHTMTSPMVCFHSKLHTDLRRRECPLLLLLVSNCQKIHLIGKKRNETIFNNMVPPRESRPKEHAIADRSAGTQTSLLSAFHDHNVNLFHFIPLKKYRGPDLNGGYGQKTFPLNAFKNVTLNLETV